MSQKNTCQDIKEFQVWRNKLYNSFGSRRETIIQLIDSVSSNQQADSVVELSLNPLFQRNYNSLYKGIQEFLPEKTDDHYEELTKNLLTTVSQTITPPKSRHFNLFGIDATPAPRPYYNTLEDKTYIYHPNPIKGNKPISIGHSYSVLAALPERNETGNVPWAVPILGDRIPSESKAISKRSA